MTDLQRDGVPEDDLWLGPFYDVDGTEILPCTTEATDAAIEQTMGVYRIVSNLEHLHGGHLAITAAVMTRFIQNDWNRVSRAEPGSFSVGFLLAYLGSRRAVGRLAEDVVCAELFQEDVFGEDRIERIWTVDEAIDAGHFRSSGTGIRCDDLLLVTRQGRTYLGEVKASFGGREYLLSSLKKAVQQVTNSLTANPDVTGATFTLVSIREKFIVLLLGTRQEIDGRPASHWRDLTRLLLGRSTEL